MTSCFRVFVVFVFIFFKHSLFSSSHCKVLSIFYPFLLLSFDVTFTVTLMFAPFFGARGIHVSHLWDTIEGLLVLCYRDLRPPGSSHFFAFGYVFVLFIQEQQSLGWRDLLFEKGGSVPGPLFLDRGILRNASLTPVFLFIYAHCVFYPLFYARYVLFRVPCESF